MSNLAKKISEMVEQMPEQEQTLVFELVRRMIPSDDVATAEDLADIAAARDDFCKGECIPLDQIGLK